MVMLNSDPPYAPYHTIKPLNHILLLHHSLAPLHLSLLQPLLQHPQPLLLLILAYTNARKRKYQELNLL